MRGRRRRGALLVVGVVLSLAGVAFAFVQPRLGPGGLRLVPRFDLGRWADSLPGHLAWLLPFFALCATLPALRALVWGYTVPAPVPPLAVRYHALAVGALAHNTVPGRLGLLAAAWFAARQVGRPVLELLLSLLVAKLLELGAIVATVATLGALTARVAPGAGLGRMATAGAVFVLAAAVVLFGAGRAAPRIGRWLEARGRAPRVTRFLGAIAAGVRGAGSPGRLALGLLVSFGPVAVAGLGYGLALRHAGAGIAGGWLLLGALTLGQMTPGLPIGTGVYVLVCAWAARALGASAADAAALAVLSQVAAVLANITVGAVSAIRHRQTLRELLALRRSAKRRAGAPAPGAELG